MSLSAGSRLGPYEITALLGSGGMGEVYRARDTRLDRTVAIKVLPSHVAADPDLRARLEREARAVAALNHALRYWGSPDSRFSTPESIQFLVMEYLEGEAVATRLEKGALPLDHALKVAIEIADALDKAHHAGIVHRDLKPGNVMLTKAGAKLLDFGLAKALDPLTRPLGSLSPGGGEGWGEGASQLPTTPPLDPARGGPLTGRGTVLGTLQYMSPEQLEGKDADARTDVFAFGALLYEMVTGRRAFEGKSQASLIGAILKDTPLPISKLQPIAPPAVDRIVSTCLAKDPDERWQSTRDLLHELKWVAEGAPVPAAVTSLPGAKSRERLAWTVAVVLAITAAAALAVPYFRTPAAPLEMRLEITTPATSDLISFAISPDGQRLVFVASGGGESRLWLRPLDGVTAQPLAGTEGASLPFWSPDSRSVGFFTAGKLMRIDIGGGLPQTLAVTNYGLGGTWSPDGVILFGTLTTVFRVPASGGEAEAVTKRDAGQSSHMSPHFLPGGRQFLFYVQGTPETQGIYVGSLDAPETTRLTAADTAGVYAPPGQTSLTLRATSRLAGAFREGGWLLFVRQGTLVARRLDPSWRELTGDPVTVADSVGSYFTAGAFSVSASGLVAYRTGGAGRRQLAWFDRSGKALGTVGAPDENNLLAPALSPDGRRVAVFRTVQSNTDVWLLDGVRTTRFTFDAGVDRYPLWSPDGSRIVFASDRTGAYDLYQKPSSGAGSEELLLESPLIKTAQGWSPDGRFLLYGVGNDPKTGFDLWVLPLDGDRPSTRSASSGSTVSGVEPSTRSGRPEPAEGQKPFVFLNATFEERVGQFSPDGRWVAYVSNESGRHEIYVRPFRGPDGTPSGAAALGTQGGQWQVSTAGGIQPRWNPNGKELFYIAPDAKLMAVPIAVNGTTLEPGSPVVLFQTRIWAGGIETYAREQYDVAPDGRFLINVVSDEAAVSPITVILNWAAGVQR